MRNDYPNHPAGPLPEPARPGEVLEVGQPRMGGWMVVILGVLMALSAIPMHASMGKIQEAKAAERGGPVEPPAPLGKIFGGLGLAFVAAGWMILKDKRVVVRLRPDGVDFPMEGLPSIGWGEVEHVDIATLVLIGAGGAQDYLGIKLRPGVLPPGPSPFSTMVMRAARAVAGWDFDVCISQNNLGMPPAHLSMQMRARVEAYRAADPPPGAPPGLPPIAATPMAARAKAARAAAPQTGRKGCALAMLGVATLSALPWLGLMAGRPLPKISVPPERILQVVNNSAIFAFVLAAIALVFVWPWADDD